VAMGSPCRLHALDGEVMLNKQSSGGRCDAYLAGAEMNRPSIGAGLAQASTCECLAGWAIKRASDMAGGGQQLVERAGSDQAGRSILARS